MDSHLKKLIMLSFVKQGAEQNLIVDDLKYNDAHLTSLFRGLTRQ